LEVRASPNLFEYPTVNLGRLEGGSTVNSVPRTATAKVDVRVTPGASTREVFERIEACIEAKPDISITGVSIREGTYTDPDDPFVAVVVDAGRTVGDQRVFRQCATGGGDVKNCARPGFLRSKLLSAATPHTWLMSIFRSTRSKRRQRGTVDFHLC